MGCLRGLAPVSYRGSLFGAVVFFVCLCLLAVINLGLNEDEQLLPMNFFTF